MIYKALITDVDGTLIPNKSNCLPTERIINSIKEAKKTVHIGIASARPYAQVKYLFDGLGLTGPSILSGGAQLVIAPGEKYYYERSINSIQVINICKTLASMKLNFWIQDDGVDFKFDELYTPRKPFVIVVPDVDKSRVREIQHIIQENNHVTVHTVFSEHIGKVDVHITHPLASKQHGILEIRKIFNIKREQIIGIGDSNNDYPLLMACGLKVAMRDATPELKAIADFIAPSVEEDAIAEVIDKFILNK